MDIRECKTRLKSGKTVTNRAGENWEIRVIIATMKTKQSLPGLTADLWGGGRQRHVLSAHGAQSGRRALFPVTPRHLPAPHWSFLGDVGRLLPFRLKMTIKKNKSGK